MDPLSPSHGCTRTRCGNWVWCSGFRHFRSGGTPFPDQASPFESWAISPRGASKWLAKLTPFSSRSSRCVRVLFFRAREFVLNSSNRCASQTESTTRSARPLSFSSIAKAWASWATAGPTRALAPCAVCRCDTFVHLELCSQTALVGGVRLPFTHKCWIKVC